MNIVHTCHDYNGSPYRCNACSMHSFLFICLINVYWELMCQEDRKMRNIHRSCPHGVPHLVHFLKFSCIFILGGCISNMHMYAGQPQLSLMANNLMKLWAPKYGIWHLARDWENLKGHIKKLNLKLNNSLTNFFTSVSSIFFYLYVFIECFLCVRYCAGYTKMNSDSQASKSSFRIGHELEIIVVLDGKGHCLWQVCIKCCGIQGKRDLEKTLRGKWHLSQTSKDRQDCKMGN